MSPLSALREDSILMRNTLILIDQIEQDMAIESAVRRARPVVLTAPAAVLAFVPLTLSAFWGQLAVVLIGGVSVGAALTLLVLPAAPTATYEINRTGRNTPETVPLR